MNLAEDKTNKNTELQYLKIDGESFFKISNHDQMNPFLMSIVSDGNHWMFISSNGGLTAGRKDADNAIFPYYTDDKLAETADITGSKSIFRVESKDGTKLWEPFSNRQFNLYNTTRNLYKSELGNKIMFEEINHDLQLTFTYSWSSSGVYGFVRKCQLTNNGSEDLEIEMIDGIQNIMPYGVSADLQGIRSNLVDAYKRNQLDKESGIGIFALSAIIVDRAEPSEALKANVVFSLGLKNSNYLLSSRQLDTFRTGGTPTEETDVKAEKGSYLIHNTITLSEGAEKDWYMITNVNHTSSQIHALKDKILKDTQFVEEIKNDIQAGSKKLKKLVAASDGLQLSSFQRKNSRHFSNTLFNIMRGGIFDDDYKVELSDFKSYFKKANIKVYNAHKSFFESSNKELAWQDLVKYALESNDTHFIRLATEYLPLKFSRRHGDPSRPWNKFSINTQSEIDGSKILDYEGNWRDIFQNWEALAHSYPAFIDGMIFKFLNASTFDGYNPYRVTKDGFDWEVIEEHDPWSYIGYWGDHQIIYLLKFLEFAETHYPGKLSSYFNQDLFVFANVPYKIKGYDDLLRNPKDTIDFDHDLDLKVRSKRREMGTDGSLIMDQNGEIYKVNLLEKLLITSLTKLSNFIPEGGIWLNTQRPEWNDANNALVGNGVSMVTLYYLHRYFKFFHGLMESTNGQVSLSSELSTFYKEIQGVLEAHKELLKESIDDSKRKDILDGLGRAGEKYRNSIYQNSYSGKKETVDTSDLHHFSETVLAFLQHSIKANERSDGMYHAYNLMTVDESAVSISYLDEMLEGQVAVLSAEYLEPKSALNVLDALKASKLFREDQYSYLLYPNKELPGFLDRNVIPEKLVQSSSLLKKHLQSGNRSIIEKDVNGDYHFNGNFRNANDVKEALDAIEANESEVKEVLSAFEAVFNHKAFTGRSGTFYGYEGLGSIYWHMVSKLLLAVSENCIHALESSADDQTVGRLLEHYYEIMEGIGANKSPKLYGAFPTDPYSHTPFTKGAQQPGMTGQVKEDILSRYHELGILVKAGQLTFYPAMLRKDEFLKDEKAFAFVDIRGEERVINIKEGSMAFSYCQVPVIYTISNHESIRVTLSNSETKEIDELSLTKALSEMLFNRTGEIDVIEVNINESMLK